MAHIYTVEKIYNFTCSRCTNWWSYAHVQRRHDLKLPEVLRRLFCPHCGHEDLTEVLDQN